MAFAGLNRLITYTEWEAITIYLNRNVLHRHIEHDQLLTVGINSEALWLRRDQAITWNAQYCIHRASRQIMAGYRKVIVLNAKYQDAALSISESRHIFRDLVTYQTPMTSFLGAWQPFEQRFSFEVLAFILVKKRCDVEIQHARTSISTVHRYR